jgi:exonuclease SbcD
MKIGIIGDIHIGGGYSLGKTDPKTQLNSRLLDFSNTFDSIIDEFESNGVTLVVITGDIYETRHPTSPQLNAFSKCIRRANSKGIEIIMIAGNHDQQSPIATTTIDIFDYLDIPNVSIFTNIGKYTSKDKSVDIILMPYRNRRMLGVTTNAEAVSKLRDSLKSIQYTPNRKKLLVGHFMVGKAVSGRDGESFSMSEIILPWDLFKGVDTVVMGHVHQHEILRKSDNHIVCYIGSMEKISFGERAHKKVSAIIDTDDISNPTFLTTNVRNLYEINFDYSEGEKHYKHQITDKIIQDIEEFHSEHNLKDAIVKLVAKVKENDLYYVSQERIKDSIMSKNVNHLAPLHISAVAKRKLRNKDINETASGKKAIASFIYELNEPEHIKKKLLKFANNIIEEIEGK